MISHEDILQTNIGYKVTNYQRLIDYLFKGRQLLFPNLIPRKLEHPF